MPRLPAKRDYPNTYQYVSRQIEILRLRVSYLKRTKELPPEVADPILESLLQIRTELQSYGESPSKTD